MNILILTGKFGMGHWSASQSLRQQLLHNFPDAKVEIEDFLAYAAPNFAPAMYKGFNMVVTYGSHLFNVYYKLTAMGHPDARPPFEGLLLDKLAELFHQYQPDAVIATHPLCAQLVSLLKEQAGTKGAYGLDLPLITCVTDVSSHPEWINRNTDCYMVASREVRRELIDKGVDPSLICITGIPVREEFRRLGQRWGSRTWSTLGRNENTVRESLKKRNVELGESSANGSVREKSVELGESSMDESIKEMSKRIGKSSNANADKRENAVESGHCANGSSEKHNVIMGEYPAMGYCKTEGISSLYGMETERATTKLLPGFHGMGNENAMTRLLSSLHNMENSNIMLHFFTHQNGLGSPEQDRMISEGQYENGKGVRIKAPEKMPVLKTSKEGKRREVLIMGGGLGLLPKSESFYHSLNNVPNTHITIITGRNRKLFERLKGRWENIQVMGYTDQVWEYMRRADLIVTKPGGITLFETIFAQVPILAWPPALQQEKGNARWLVEEGIGWVAAKKNCAGEIQAILADEKRLAGARRRMGQLKEQMKAESLNGLMEVIAMSQSTAG